VRIDLPHGLSPSDLKSNPITFADFTLTKIYVPIIKGRPGEVLVEPCGCSFYGGERFKTCDGCLQRRLGP